MIADFCNFASHFQLPTLCGGHGRTRAAEVATRKQHKLSGIPSRVVENAPVNLRGCSDILPTGRQRHGLGDRHVAASGGIEHADRQERRGPDQNRANHQRHSHFRLLALLLDTTAPRPATSSGRAPRCGLSSRTRSSFHPVHPPAHLIDHERVIRCANYRQETSPTRGRSTDKICCGPAISANRLEIVQQNLSSPASTSEISRRWHGLKRPRPTSPSSRITIRGRAGAGSPMTPNRRPKRSLPCSPRSCGALISAEPDSASENALSDPKLAAGEIRRQLFAAVAPSCG